MTGTSERGEVEAFGRTKRVSGLVDSATSLCLAAAMNRVILLE